MWEGGGIVEHHVLRIHDLRIYPQEGGNDVLLSAPYIVAGARARSKGQKFLGFLTALDVLGGMSYMLVFVVY